MADKWANAKSNQQSIQKPWKIIKSRVWNYPGGSQGRLGDQFGPRAALGSKSAPKGRESLFFFSIKMGLGPTFRGFFLVFFEVLAFRFFMILGARGSILASILALLWELWAFGKTVESVVKVLNFRGLAPARLSLLTGPDCGCVSVSFFCICLWFSAVWELSFWELLGLIAVKKEVWKKKTNKGAKRGAQVTRGNRQWGCGSP